VPGDLLCKSGWRVVHTKKGLRKVMRRERVYRGKEDLEASPKKKGKTRKTGATPGSAKRRRVRRLRAGADVKEITFCVRDSGGSG